MRLKHQFRDQNVEREVSDGVPLGFLLPNKMGGMLFFDAGKDQAQYYARLNSSTIRIIQDMNFESAVVGLNNRFHSLEIEREDQEHELFVPHYMNAVMLKSKKGMPMELVFNLHDIEKKKSIAIDSIYEKQGRVIVSSSTPDNEPLFIALQGENLFYDHRSDKGSTSMDVVSPRVALAVAASEEEAIVSANHLFENEQRIKSIQENCISTKSRFADPEATLAYACALNGMDHMFMHDKESEDGTITPIPQFSNVTKNHMSIAVYSMLLEGEFGIAKKALMSEMNSLHDRLAEGNIGFDEAAWPMFLFGKLLNMLCTRGKLYDYFSKDDVTRAATKALRLAKSMNEGFSTDGEGVKAKGGANLESHALMLSVLDLAYALTKSEEYKQAEHILKDKTRVMLLNGSMPSINENNALSREDVMSVFLTAYIYPVLLSDEEWRDCFDNLLDKMHNNFQTLQSKMAPISFNAPLELELFGLASLAAIVLNRIDPEHYEKQINQVLRTAVTDVLYKGIIGRPSSAFSEQAEPDKKAVIENTHLLNNALFLEMIKECA
jgi:hypothetical protein